MVVGRLGRLLASAAFVAAGAAHAQCTSAPAPPPTSNETYSFANQSFNNPPPYYLFNAASDGCDGASRGDDDNGEPGSPGQGTGSLTSNASNVIVSGAFIFSDSGAVVQALAGTGGNGGNTGNAILDDLTGGAGGAGGAAGPVVVNFSGSISPAGTAVAPTGMFSLSTGGAGGNGGVVGKVGAGNKTGGDGGTGGAGGAVQFTGSGEANATNRALIVRSQGGSGGAGGLADSNDAFVVTYGGQGADGGQAGSAALTWQSGAITAGNQGALAASAGGVGGAGGAATGGNTNYGGNGGSGGNSGNATVSMAAGSVTLVEQSYNPYNAALIALSEAGAGGAGGRSGGLNGAQAGNGGNGGTAGAASASVIGDITLTGLGTGPGHAILVLSAGGQGGAGGNASAAQGSSGGGGLAGAAGSAALTIGSQTAGATVTGSGKYANAAVVQSIGGGGGNGGSASFFEDSGAGAPGGDGGSVNADITNGVLLTSAASASGLIAQSVGGGGGIGGDATGVDVGVAVSIGGNGGLGGNGAAVTVQIGENAIIGATNVLGDNGVLAQSVGGSGGAGGSAVAKGSGVLSLTIGGDAGGGGAAGTVQISSDGLITSYGDHAGGLQAQSIGGGGGKGGAAVSFDVAAVPATSVAIGGKGGSGGPADNATVSSSGQVTTYGHNAYGIVAQSVGGGGGSGGASAARVVSISPSESFPAISVSVAVGGAGGSGNTGATATASNSGLVTTAGESAYALVAQSVGGGGGIGGDATAASYSGGDSPGLTVSFAVAVGGSGGTGATGGAANVDNSGLLLTYGNDAYGVFAQSVGGGGGAGGTGDSSATASKAQASFAASLAIGGTGGTGGHGGVVNGSSSGGIATNGDGSDGMFVQSVGGGGGAGGGGIGAANGGNLTISVGLGGSGGAGGDGGAVTAANSGAIVTRGTDAVGLLAQSVGGGGGKGGKAGATSGGVNPVANAKNLAATLAGGLNLGASVTEPIAGIFAIGKIANEVYSAANELYAIAQQAAGGPYQVGNAVKIGVGISVGGKGGAAGDGGEVTASNTGEISNFGAMSDGIFAQSIGGGGGKGGAATSTDTATNDTKTQLAIGGGGDGGAGGDGGTVSVVNDSGASVQTQGVLGFGVFAQSVGGGGGTGGVAGTVSGSLVSLSVGIGGDGGSQGAGGNVTVSNDGSVTTSGKHGIGIFAQSIGGGGGLARSMTTNETFDPADIANNPQGRLGDIHGLTLSFNGSTNTTGNAGTAEVDVAGSVTTSGRTAHAILAQSIGGGGGAAIGGLVLSGDTKTGTGNGTGDTVTITTTAGAVISTAGDGAYGILAQSIGGGGGLGGSFADVTGVQVLAGGTNVINKGTGDAGEVAISLTGTRLTTAGTLAPAIYAQSLGGGGGLIGQGSALFSGGAGGSGSGDTVSVTLVNTTITATGIQSPGIVIQTNGSGGAAVSIDAQSSVTGGAINEPAQTTMAGAIYIQQGSGNTITNAGSITGAGNLNATAILSDAAVKIDNSGTITGAVVTGGNGSVFTNAAGGTFNPGATIALGSGGALVNRGVLVIGGAGTIGTTVLTGDLSSDGRIVIDADFAGGTGDRLSVTGKATMADTIAIAPRSMRNARLALVSAAGGLTVAPQLAAAPSANQLFSYRFDSDGTTLYATPQARFAAEASGLGTAQRAVAGHLQSLFDSGALFDSGFTALANLASPDDYAPALDSLIGQGLGAMAAQRYQSSRRFVSDIIDACDTAADSDCVWARFQGGRSTQDETAEAFGYVADFQVFEMGGQVRVGEGLYLAGALAYEHSTLSDRADTARINGDSLFAAIGLHYRRGGFELVGSLDGGYGWYNSLRQITVGSNTSQASADPRLWNIGLALAASYRVPLGDAAFVKPFAAVRGSNVEAGAYTEQSSSPFALQVLGESNLAASGTIGTALGTSMALGDGKTRLEPFIIAAVEFSGDTDWSTSARFAGEGGSVDPFTVQTRAPGTFGRFGIGAEIAGPHFALTLSYNPEVGSGYVTQQGVARLTYRF
jgi:uncharacterized protein YhjY with autotransporter beta-barrel domain